MTANSVLTHSNVGVLALSAIEAPEVVTSAWIDEQLAETYERVGVKPGTLSELAGIEERRWWPADVQFDQAAAMAGRAAIEAAGIDRERIGMLISTSVCKDHLEPSVACSVHHQLELPPSCLNFDVGNACLGVINGMQIAALRTAKPMRYSCLHCGNTLATSPLSGAIWMLGGSTGFLAEKSFRRRIPLTLLIILRF